MNEHIKGTLALVCHGMASIDSNSFSPDQIIATKSVVSLEDLNIDVLLMIKTSTIGGFVIENVLYLFSCGNLILYSCNNYKQHTRSCVILPQSTEGMLRSLK